MNMAETWIKERHYMNLFPSKFYLIKRSIKYFFQRRFRGWDDSETWSLDYSLAKYIVSRLKRFKELNNGYPSEFTSESWDETIDKMIAAFEFIGGEERWCDVFPDYVEDGRNLFHKYYYDLWW